MKTRKQIHKRQNLASSKYGATKPVLVFAIAAVVLIAFGATFALLAPSGSVQKSGAGPGSGSTPNSHSSVSTSNSASMSESSSSQSTQTYSSYPPPKNDILFISGCGDCKSNIYDGYILNDSALFGVPDPMIIKAQIGLESGFHPNAVSKLANSVCGGSTDYGLMQINPNCNSVNVSELFIPSYNLYWGIRFWANDYLYMQQKWSSSCSTSMLISGVLELYNGGSNYVGSTCGSFPNGTVYIGKISNFYYRFCQEANYTPITQLPNDTYSGSQ